MHHHLRSGLIVLAAAATALATEAAPAGGCRRASECPYARDRQTVRRFTGLGEGVHCSLGARGVRRFGGLGDGTCGDPYYPYFKPYLVIVEGGGAVACPPAPRYWWLDTRVPIVIEAAPQVAPDEAPPDDGESRGAVEPASLARQAWARLRAGDGRGALRDFAVLSLRSTGEGADPAEAASARLGYGLAAALLGRDETAAWALRRAEAIDADAVRRAVIDHGLEDLLPGLRRAPVDTSALATTLDAN